MKAVKEVRTEVVENAQETAEFFHSCQLAVQIISFTSEDLPSPSATHVALVIGPHVADVKEQAA